MNTNYKMIEEKYILNSRSLRKLKKISIQNSSLEEKFYNKKEIDNRSATSLILKYFMYKMENKKIIKPVFLDDFKNIYDAFSKDSDEFNPIIELLKIDTLLLNCPIDNFANNLFFNCVNEYINKTSLIYQNNFINSIRNYFSSGEHFNVITDVSLFFDSYDLSLEDRKNIILEAFNQTLKTKNDVCFFHDKKILELFINKYSLNVIKNNDPESISHDSVIIHLKHITTIADFYQKMTF